MSRPTFTPVSDVAWAREPVPPDLVDGLLPAGILAELFGPPNAGKTFLALSLSMAIAQSARAWVGHRIVTSGAVAYCVGEGHTHFPRRLQALRTDYELEDDQPSGVLFLRESFSLLKPDDVTAVIDALRAALAGKPLRLLTLDPFARFLVPGDENAGKDMGIAVEALHRLRAELATTVLVTHHTGWGNTDRERGHSGLRGAADVVYGVKADEGTITVEDVKERDSAARPVLRVRLRPVDESCVIELVGDVAPADRTVTTLTPKQQRILDALQAVVLDEPVPYSRWKVAAGAADTTFDRVLTLLVRSGFVVKHGHGRRARYQPTGALPPSHPHFTPTGAPDSPPFSPPTPIGVGVMGVGGMAAVKEASPPRGLDPDDVARAGMRDGL